MRSRNGKPQNIFGVEAALFGADPHYAVWKDNLRTAWMNSRQSVEIGSPEKGQSATSENEVTVQAEEASSRRERAIRVAERKQQPAAYRFTIRHEKIDLYPEPTWPEDPVFARDTFEELFVKTQELHERLRRSNSARRPCLSVERLLAVLSGGFENLRPGVLMSRVRSIEADQAAFDSEDVRQELFADALAVKADTVQTARDLMSVFPVVRRIEAERLALDLDRHSDIVPAIQHEMAVISEMAAHSEALTSAAQNALAQNDAPISEAHDTLLRNSLVADNALVVKNFVGAVGSKLGIEVADLGIKSWQAVKEGFPQGLAAAARLGPLLALGCMIAGPAGGVAAVLPAFGPVAKLLRKMVNDGLDKGPGLPNQISHNMQRLPTKRKSRAPTTAR